MYIYIYLQNIIQPGPFIIDTTSKEKYIQPGPFIESSQQNPWPE